MSAESFVTRTRSAPISNGSICICIYMHIYIHIDLT